MAIITLLIPIILNIVLPTLDTVLHINLVSKLYQGNRLIIAAASLAPILLNYVFCFITFLKKEKNKKFTFIFPLLNIYPHFGMNNHYQKSLD